MKRFGIFETKRKELSYIWERKSTPQNLSFSKNYTLFWLLLAGIWLKTLHIPQGDPVLPQHQAELCEIFVSSCPQVIKCPIPGWNELLMSPCKSPGSRISPLLPAEFIPASPGCWLPAVTSGHVWVVLAANCSQVSAQEGNATEKWEYQPREGA